MSDQRTRKIPRLERDQDGNPICRHWDCSNLVQKPRKSWCSQACVDDALIQSSPSHARAAVQRRDKGVCAACGTDTQEIRATIARLRNWARYKATAKRIAARLGIEGGEWELNQAINRGGWLREQDHYERHKDNPRIHRYRRPEPPEQRCGDTICRKAERFDRWLSRQARIRMKRYRLDLARQGFDPGRRSFWDCDHVVEVVNGGGQCGLENLQTLCQPCHKAKTKQLASDRAYDRKRQKLEEQFGPEIL